MQRDRDFRSYEDSEARYELRPSAWIEPVGTWGPGRVELVQLNTPDETNDNIVAYWVPEPLPAKGSRWTFLSAALAGHARHAASAGRAGSCKRASAAGMPSWRG